MRLTESLNVTVVSMSYVCVSRESAELYGVSSPILSSPVIFAKLSSAQSISAALMEPSESLKSFNQTPSHYVIRETTFCWHWPCNPTEDGMILNETNQKNWFWSRHKNPQEVILHLFHSSSALFLPVSSKQVHTSFLFLVHTNTIPLLYAHRTVAQPQSNQICTEQHNIFYNSLKCICIFTVTQFYNSFHDLDSFSSKRDEMKGTILALSAEDCKGAILALRSHSTSVLQAQAAGNQSHSFNANCTAAWENADYHERCGWD